MNSTWILKLYPEQWRARYEPEFRALLEEAPMGFMDLFDIRLRRDRCPHPTLDGWTRCRRECPAAHTTRSRCRRQASGSFAQVLLDARWSQRTDFSSAAPDQRVDLGRNGLVGDRDLGTGDSTLDPRDGHLPMARLLRCAGCSTWCD